MHPARHAATITPPAQPPVVNLKLSCNLDLWGMDVATKENMDGGLVDSLIEHIMSGFGPHAALKPMPGFAGKVFGWTQETFLSTLGNGRPFVVDLSGKPHNDACGSCSGTGKTPCGRCDGTGRHKLPDQ